MLPPGSAMVRSTFVYQAYLPVGKTFVAYLLLVLIPVRMVQSQIPAVHGRQHFQQPPQAAAALQLHRGQARQPAPGILVASTGAGKALRAHWQTRARDSTSPADEDCRGMPLASGLLGCPLLRRQCDD